MHFGNEAAVKRTAFLAQAGFGAGVELGPQRARFGQRRQFSAIASLRCLLPGSYGAVLLNFLETAEHGLVSQVVEFFSAEIIAPPLHVADAQLAVAIWIERLLQERNVFVEKLLLQILGAGGNQDALAGPDHGHQIGKSLPRTGARFDDKVAFLLECLLDCLRHLQLPATEFVSRMGP